MRKNAMIGVSALVLLTGGSAAGAAVTNSPIDGSGVIHGCYRTKDRGGSYAVRLQNAGTSCPPGYTAISWNQQGHPGPAGSGAVVQSLSPGDTSCADGGASITDGDGNTAYACDGARGAVGPQGPAGPANVDYGVVQVTSTVQRATCSFDGAAGGPDPLTVSAAYQASTGLQTCEITGFPAGAVPTVTFLSPDNAASAGHAEVQFSPGQNLYVPISIPSIVNGVGGTADEFTFMIIDPSS